MVDSEKHSLIEIALTLALISLAITSLGGVSGLFSSSLLLITFFGFIFSWFIRSSAKSWYKSFVNFLALLVCLWIIYSLFGSALLYKEVITICIKGLIVLEAIMSFNAHDPAYVTYAQILSIPLFFCIPVFANKQNDFLMISVAAYVVFWMVIIRVKFYRFLHEPLYLFNLKKNYSFIFLTIFFCTNVLIAGVLFTNIPLTKINQGGIFLSENLETASEGGRTEKQYYELQDRLLKEIPEAIPIVESTDKKYDLLSFVNSLVKDLSTVQEVDDAQVGLKSYFADTNVEIEDTKRIEIVELVEDYVDTKCAFNREKIKEQIAEYLKEPLLLQNRVKIMRLLEEIELSDSLAIARQAAEELKDFIKNSALKAQAKEEMQELVDEFLQWKELEFQYKNIGDDAQVLPQETVIVQPESVTPEPEKKQEEEQSRKETGTGGLFFTLENVFDLLMATGFFLIIGIPLLLAVLFILVLGKKNKLSGLYRSNKREFILQLYENLKGILSVFGLKCSRQVAPLVFAEKVEKKLLIPDNLFLQFSRRFEKAKYSSQAIEAEETDIFFNEYNKFLRIVFSKHGKFVLFFKYYLSILFSVRPVFFSKH